jgi:hypothetical protein
MRPTNWLLLASLATACAGFGAGRLPASASHTIAVLPPSTKTPDQLLVAGSSFLERYATGTSRVTVADVLESEARIQLERRGFTVVAPDDVDAATHRQTPGSPSGAAEIAAASRLPGLALYLEIHHWEPDAPTHPSYVLVGARAALVDPATQQVVWQNERSTGPVGTPGEISAGAAYVTAARKVAEELLAPLGAERPGA